MRQHNQKFMASTKNVRERQKNVYVNVVMVVLCLVGSNTDSEKTQMIELDQIFCSDSDNSQDEENIFFLFHPCLSICCLSQILKSIQVKAYL